MKYVCVSVWVHPVYEYTCVSCVCVHSCVHACVCVCVRAHGRQAESS